MADHDPLLPLLPRYGFQTKVFFTGEFCGANQFTGVEPVGHLHLLRRGRVVMEHPDGTTLAMDEPGLVFYPRPFAHRLVIPAGAVADLVCATITFRQAATNPISRAFPPFVHASLASARELALALEMLFAEAASNGLGCSLVLDRASDVVIIQMLRFARRSGLLLPGTLAGLCDAALSPVLERVLAEPGHAWQIEEMATLCGMARSKFIYTFQRVVGISPGNFVLESRMNLARWLLAENRPVAEVAALVGYRHQPAFSRAFISHAGIAPGDWKKNRDSGQGARRLHTP